MAEQLSTGMQGSLYDKMVTDFANGVLVVFSGTQPASADADEGIGSTATILTVITNAGGDPADLSSNGINLEKSSGTLIIASGEEWKDTSADATGTATWFRYYDTNRTTGASTSAKRFDGRVSTSGAELNLNTTSIVSGGPVIVSSFVYTLPKS